MTSAVQVERRPIPISAITLSNTEAQIQRRKSFKQEELAELAESIKQHSLINPVLVRPLDDGDRFELVAGERRYMAAQLAGLDTIDATVRPLTDEQVLEVQLIENLQRDGLHPLHEAEGYEQLMRLHGHTADELADRIGKSRRYVYARIQLLKLCKEAREAFYDGKLNASTALLVARIPAESLQKEALEDICGEGRPPMSTRQAADYIQRHYMLSLADAPFPTIIENLVKGTPACHRCPKNTNAQPELFEDVKASSAGVCTDLACFRQKQTAHLEERIAQARKNGQKVIEGDKAKEIFPYGTHYAQGGYELLADVKDRLKKEDAPIVLVRARTGYGDDSPEQLIEVVEKQYVAAPKPRASARLGLSTKEEAERERAKKLRATLFRMIFEKTKVTLREAAEQLVVNVLNHDFDTGEILEALGFENWNLDRLDKEIAKLKPDQLARLMAVLPLSEDLGPWGDADKIEFTAKRLKIDIAAVEKELFPDEQKTPAKASKKKAAARKHK